MSTVTWYCGRCRRDQSVGANLVGVHALAGVPRVVVVCPTCTTRVDTPVDMDTFGALIRAVQVESTVARESAALELAGDAAASLIGGDLDG